MKLYSTKCPKCLVLEAKLKLKNLDFDLVTDIDEVVKIGKEHKIRKGQKETYFKIE